MTQDARFEDADDRPLRLLARDEEDLKVIAALAQDAVFPASEMQWLRAHRQFAVLLNRFRWEDAAWAEREGRPYERVQSLLIVDNAFRVQFMGVAPGEPETILELLDIAFEAGSDGTGWIVLTLAGDGGIRIQVDEIEVGLKDVSRPYVAPSRQKPEHPL